MMCRLTRDQVKLADHAIGKLDGQIAPMAARWQREQHLLVSVPGFGDVVAWTWLAEIGPAPHKWFSGHDKLARHADQRPAIAPEERVHLVVGTIPAQVDIGEQPVLRILVPVEVQPSSLRTRLCAPSAPTT